MLHIYTGYENNIDMVEFNQQVMRTENSDMHFPLIGLANQGKLSVRNQWKLPPFIAKN